MSFQAIFAITSLIVTGGSAAVLYEHTLAPDTTVVEGSAEFGQALGDAVASQGGIEGVQQHKADYDLAASTGIPLAEAGLSASDFDDLARQGSNVVIPCEVGHREVDYLNSILEQAPGAATIPCGAFNPDAPAIAMAETALTPIAASNLPDADKQELLDAGFDSVGSCEGASGILSEIFGSAGAQTWVCGHSSSESN